MRRDPDDDVVLSTETAGRCDAIVTGDRDLLDLVTQITIVSPRGFWSLEASAREADSDYRRLLRRPRPLRREVLAAVGRDGDGVFVPDTRLALGITCGKASPDGARAFLSQVFEAARSLSTFTERGRLVPDLNDPEVREVYVGRYRVLYEVHPEAVWTMRVLHSSQDLLLALGRSARAEAEGEE